MISTMLDDEPLTRDCPACHSTVPAVSFCGHCGADLDGPVGRVNLLLRPRSCANAHGEPVWMPYVSSSLLPRMPGESRKPFRLSLILVLIAVGVFAAARMAGPLGVLAVLGWPLLFLIYLWESDVFRDLPARIMATAMVLGIGLGVGTWLVAGDLIAGAYEVSIGSGLQLLEGVLSIGFLVSLGGAVLMLIPAVVTRAFRAPAREALDGFVVGAFGALWYSTASAATILAPQFTQGLLAGQGSVHLLEDAVTYGIVSSAITTAAGGVVGLALWFQPDRRPNRNPAHARRALAVCAVLAVGCYCAVWAVDSRELPGVVDMTIQLGLATVALLIARSAVQIALLHENPDPASGEPVLCPHCVRVVPDEAFCVACGSAARASSRSSRQLRRAAPPVREHSLG